MESKKASTLAVDSETRRLIREYCFVNRINMRSFVKKLANDKLETFKKRMNELRNARI